jgi:DNA-binding GntR family transcriptional regulator
MGSRGGKKAAQRWKDRDSDYAKNELAKLEKTHRKKRIAGQTTKARIQTLVGQHYIETGKVLSRKEIMTETGLSRATVTRHLAVLKSEGLIPET